MATFTVTNANDSGAGSLRQAILDANAAAGSDTIIFDNSLNSVRIATDSSLTITDDLIIDAGTDESHGPRVTIDAQGRHRAFVIDDVNPETLLSVTLDGLEIIRGSSGSNLIGGAGIDSQENLTLLNSVITNNDGTGIANDIGDLTISNSLIAQNEGQFGGGVYSNRGNLTITNSLIRNNMALGEQLETAQGGGIYNGGGALSVRDSMIQGNRTARTGGLLIGGDAAGAGIYSAGSALEIVNSTLRRNTAEGFGGAIAHLAGEFVIRNTTMVMNDASGAGGGLYSRSPEGGMIVNSTISENSALGNGGGIFNDAGSLTVAESTLSENEARGMGGQGTAAQGGGIFNSGESLTLDDTEVTTNAADGRGGGIAHVNGQLRVEDATITGNAAVGSGGGVLFQADSNAGTGTINRSTISSNSTSGTGGLGGGIHSDRGLLTVSNSTVSENSTTGDNSPGGGIAVDSGSGLNLFGSLIRDNSTTGANSNGGGIFTDLVLTRAVNTTISGNSTTGANSDGGGLSSRAGGLVLQNATISDNAGATGGGLFIDDAPGSGQGTGLNVANSIIAGNRAADEGNEVAAIDFIDTGITNNLLGDNSQTNADAFSGFIPTATDITATSDSTAPTTLTSIIRPLADNGGPTLTQALPSDSPAIDAGSNSRIAIDSTDEDGDGRTDEAAPFDQRGDNFARVVAGTVDIGAFEQAVVPVVPMVNGQTATIFVNDDNIVVGNATQAGRVYRGRLTSNTDGTDNPRDVIVGTDGRDIIRAGLAGNDLIDAGDGNDRIIFGSTALFVGAGDGNDVVRGIGSSRAGGIIVDLGRGNDRFSATRNNHFITGSGNNIIDIGRGNDTVQTEDGNDVVYATRGGGNNTLNLGGGMNVVWVQRGNYTITTGDGQDFIGLGRGTDVVDAGDGDNVVYALGASPRGNKDITTGLGDDNIWTGAGSDRIDAGAGTNRLAGGAGADQFTVRMGALNIITDFELGTDRIALAGLSQSELTIVQGTGDRAGEAVASVQGEVILRVLDVNAEALDAASNFTMV